MSNQKKHAVYLALFLAVLGLIGCVQQPKAEALPEEFKKPLLMRLTWKAYSGRGEAIQKIIDSHDPDGKGVYRVSLVDGDEDFDAIKRNMESESSDIYVLPYRYIQYFGDQKALMDISPYFSDEQDGFYPELWELAAVDGGQYGVPWLGHSVGLVYNEDILLKAGVEISKIVSMEAFLEAVAKVEANTEAQGVGLVGANHNDVSWMVNQFVYGFGSSLVDESGKKVTINNGQSAAALGFYKNILGPHAQESWRDDTGVEVMAAFRNQKVAFEFQGPWGITDIWKNGNPFPVAAIPLERIGLRSEVGPMMLALPVGLEPEKKEAALDLIRYLISKPAQEKIMDGEYSPEHDAYYPFRIPVRKDMEDSQVFQKYPEFIPFLEGFRNSSIDVPVPKWQLIKDQVYAPGLHKVMVGEMSIEALLEKTEIEGDKILNSN